MNKGRYQDFIGIYDNLVTDEFCDDIVDFFKTYEDESSPGAINGRVVDKSVKDSQDICLAPQHPYYKKIAEALKPCVDEYVDKYPNLLATGSYTWGTVEPINIQCYPPKGGYHAWHHERSGDKESNTRLLTWMIYLNTIDDVDYRGGTEFYYQNLQIKAVKNRTLIWPAEFTHEHRGIISNKEKIITTGWLNWKVDEKIEE